MPLTFHQHQLKNGLDIIAEENPDSHSIALGLFVKTGARDEDPKQSGVSHFLEHMMFKGSEKYTWEDVNRIFDEIGARYNAFTSQEMTAYYANVLPEFTEQAVEHLAHLLRPSIRVEDFTTEKKVILEEIAMYLDDPGHRLYEDLMSVHFGNHPLSMSVLGSTDSIKNLQQPQMAEYFARRYGPGNMVLVATGKLEFEEVVFGFYPHDGCGSFYLALTTEPARAQQALDIALAELNKVKTDLTDDEVERAKNKIASSIVLQGEVPLGRMRAMGGQWIYNKEYRSLEKDMATLNAVTTDSLRQLMRDFPFDPMTIVSLGPGEK